MPRYKCTNALCPDFDQVKLETYSMSKVIDGKLVDSASICPVCGEVRELVIVEGLTTQMQGGPNVCKH